MTIWLAPDLYTIEPCLFRALEPGETYHFTTHLAAAHVTSAEQAVRAAQGGTDGGADEAAGGRR